MGKKRPQGPAPQEIKAALAAVRQVYAELEQRALPRQCVGRGDCCQFSLTGRTPNATAAEAHLAVQSFRATGRKQLSEPTDGACPFLKDLKCLIYPDRPFACRTHFCKAAGGIYPREHVRDLIQRLEEISRTLGETQACALPLAVARAL